MEPETELILGIDDAGRGPLIGPMALAGCLITKKIEEEFKELEVKDSKLIPPKKRELLAEKIKQQAIAFHVELTFPKEIDEKINSGTNLNKIEAIRAAEIVNKLTKNRNEKIKIIIDCPSVNKESWKKDVVELINNPKNLTIACEHKADRDYVAVSAASILAKSAREFEIEKIKKTIGKDFGSGYPSDPVTIKFLKEHHEEYKEEKIFRETWQTFKNCKKQVAQKRLGEF